ncbi:MAG: Uma2 family endonuclease [Ktedonobacteraceae bacterium]
MAVNPQYNGDTISLHGIPMTEEAFEQLIGVESPYRYELIDGQLYDMTGSSPEHSTLAGNIDGLLREQLGKGGPCRVHREQYVAVPGKPPVVPDVVVTCDRADWDKDKRLKPFKIRSPLLVFEVLSPSTEKYDRTEKFNRYKLCSTLEVYVLVSQDKPLVNVYRKSTGWQQENFAAEQIIKFDQLDLELPLSTLYEGVL